MRKVVICLLAVSLLSCFVSVVQAYSLKIDALIDGRSLLIIQGDTVQWHNDTYFVPGKHEGLNLPTTLTTADMAVDWYPNWPNGIEENVFSDTFTGLNRPLAAIDQNVSLSYNDQEVRYSVPNGEWWDFYYTLIYIAQQPSAANNYTLIIVFDDDPYYGHWPYSATINYIAGDYISGASTVPLPPTVLLLGSGLLGLAGWRRFRRS